MSDPGSVSPGLHLEKHSSHWRAVHTASGHTAVFLWTPRKAEAEKRLCQLATLGDYTRPWGVLKADTALVDTVRRLERRWRGPTWSDLAIWREEKAHLERIREARETAPSGPKLVPCNCAGCWYCPRREHTHEKGLDCLTQ